MRIAALFLAATAAFAAGRLELFHAPSGQPEQQITGTFDMPAARVTDAASVRFRIRNVGDAAVTLTRLGVSGTGFSATGAPSLPHIVAAGTNVDFTVRFSPPNYGSYSALLQINAATYVIKALGEAAVGLTYNDALLTAGDTVDFGRIERGRQTTRTMVLKNTTPEPLGVARATITGPNFFFAAGPPTVHLPPGGSAAFEIVFQGTASGVYKERLTLDGREFFLTGTVVDPPLPRPTVVLESAALRSGQQGRVSVRFAEPSRVKAKGTLRLELQPFGTARDNDEALRFMTGARVVEFNVAEGDSAVHFGTQEALVFQAGTTAGTIVVTVEAGGFTDRATASVEPEPVRLDGASAVRSAGALDVRLTGFDNTRSVTAMNFTFHLAGGQSIPVRVPVAADFGRWWTESKLGGIFAFRASFPVTGDSSQIRAVDVEIANGQGSTRTERLTF
jgi:hypothetical protein